MQNNGKWGLCKKAMGGEASGGSFSGEKIHVQIVKLVAEEFELGAERTVACVRGG